MAAVFSTGLALSKLAGNAISGVLAYFGWYRERRSTQLALARALETYARECADAIEASDSHRRERLPYGRKLEAVPLPTFAYPADIKWAAVSMGDETILQDFTAFVASSRSRLKRPLASASVSWQMYEMEWEAAFLGQSALQFGAILRRKAKAQSFKGIGEDLEESFERAIERHVNWVKTRDQTTVESSQTPAEFAALVAPAVFTRAKLRY